MHPPPVELVANAGDVDLVVLLDDARRPFATMPKSEVHTAGTPLHLAFSVYAFDRLGRLLVTRRALGKRTWPGVWTNSCCGHVAPGETPERAARRRSAEELGLQVTDLRSELPDFAYRAVSPEGIVENEVCPVFSCRVESDPVPDPDEVAEWRWVGWDDYRELVARTPWAVSPWSAAQVPLLAADLPAHLDGRDTPRSAGEHE